MYKRTFIVSLLLLLSVPMTEGAFAPVTQRSGGTLSQASGKNALGGVESMNEDEIKQKIRSFIEEDRKNGVITPSEAAVFLDFLEKGYPNYVLMKEDLEMNVLGSLWYAPWYEAALKISLIATVSIALIMFFQLTASSHEKHNNYKKIPAMLRNNEQQFLVDLYDDSKYSPFITSMLMGLAFSVVSIVPTFVMTFCFIGIFIFLGNNMLEMRDSHKYKFCTYLIDRGIPLEANFNNETNGNFIWPALVLNYLGLTLGGLAEWSVVLGIYFVKP